MNLWIKIKEDVLEHLKIMLIKKNKTPYRFE